MAREEVFNAAKSAFSMYGGLFNGIAQEIGMEKALELHAKQGESFGAMIGEMLRQQLGNKGPDTKTFSSILRLLYVGFGFDAEFDVGPTSISIKVTRCPFYEGARMARLDHETIGNMCKAMANAEYTKLKEYYPKTEGKVKYRESPEGYCLEQFTLKE